MLVSIVTPATGHPALAQAIQSVQDQDYPHLEYLIVIDGAERREAVEKILGTIVFKHPTHGLELPYITGHSGYRGHRIYGLSGYIVQGDFLVFLDEDNWFDPHHISSLVEWVKTNDLDWSYALRKIVSPTGELITFDDSESLGHFPIWNTDNRHHIDTNCFFIKTPIAVQLSSIWYDRYAQDQLLCYSLLKQFPKGSGSGLYTVNYRVKIDRSSVHPGFFLQGNAWIKTRYRQPYPWQKSDIFPEVKLNELTLGQSPLSPGNTAKTGLNYKQSLIKAPIAPNRHFIILSHPGAGCHFLQLLLNQHPKLHCSGQLFHADLNHTDAVYARDLLAQSQPLTLGRIPDFFEVCAGERQRESVGFELQSLPFNTLKPEEIAVLIESGYKIIFLQRKNLLKAFCSWHLDSEQISPAQDCSEPEYSQSSPSPSFPSLTSIDPPNPQTALQWMRHCQQFLTWAESLLQQRLWGYCNLEIEDLEEAVLGNESRLKATLILAPVFNYLGVEPIEVTIPNQKIGDQTFYHQLKNSQELEAVCGYSLYSGTHS